MASNVVTISQGKRKGFQLDLGLRRAKAAKSDRIFPKDSAPPKYSDVPHPLLKLTRTALPAEVSDDYYERAVANFSCLVTKKVQTNYATSVRHYLAAEVELGRKFSSPPTPTEMVFLTTFLLGRGLKMDTVRSYLSAIRFYLLSQGIASPPRLPPLAEQLISGKAKADRNPNLVATKRQRRAITIEMLSLLGNAISQRDDWSEHEKSLRWSTILMAWWGSFRIGKLLSSYQQTFNPTCCLLGSDVTLKDDGAVALWLRSPKVWVEDTGVIVEVWPVQERPALDPVSALRTFLHLRSKVFGEAETLPLYLHEDGHIFTKAELNKDLKDLLAFYPVLAQSEVDSWTGHSFRSGLSTLLSILGFTEVGPFGCTHIYFQIGFKALSWDKYFLIPFSKK